MEPLERACSSETGPIDELAQWTSDFLNERQIRFIQFQAGLLTAADMLRAEVIDRFPLFSSPIYAPVTRAKVDEGFDTEWYNRALHSLSHLEPLIIYCLPPVEVSFENVQRTKGSQMVGVLDNHHTIDALYRYQAATFKGLFEVSVHDYTKYDAEGRKQWVAQVAETYRRGIEEIAKMEARLRNG